MSSGHRIFLLSPANCSGKRAALLFRKAAGFPLAARLRSGEGAPLGEVYAFISGLYFRGKLAYARAFASPPDGAAGVHIITPGLGLREPETVIDLAALRAIARVAVDPRNRRYVGPLRRDADRLAAGLPPGAEAVLLGSLATPKYLLPLGYALGTRLRFPREFIGLGDMSRGSLLLRSAAERRELTYIDDAALPDRRGRTRRQPAA